MDEKPKIFWHPLTFWQVLLWFLLASLIGNLAIVALREGLGLGIPGWVGGGVGGPLGVLFVTAAANRKRKGS